MTYKIVLVGIAFFLFSCGDKTEKEHEHDHDSSSIVLNDGEKWLVDTNMMLHIQNMQTDMKTFSGITMEDYAKLATQLETNLDLLTSNCTMSGPAHDELHKWLVPYINLIDEFTSIEKLSKQQEIHQEIKESFNAFNQYFQ
jgi:hypothetical protein